MLTSALAQQFNPLNSFNDQLTPVSIQVSEKYQSLLHDYCTQSTEDFVQSQFYLWLIIGLLMIFSLMTRNSVPQRISNSVASISPPSSSSASKNNRKLTTTFTSGKLLASEHEANLNINSSQFCFQPNISSSLQGTARTGHVILVTLVCTLIYTGSVLLHIYGNSFANYDLISSITMVLIAFVALIGIFLPVISQVHRYDNLLSSPSKAPTMSASDLVQPSGNYPRRNLLDSQAGKWQQAAGNAAGSTTSNKSSSAFAMFPEFSPTGLKRPSSVSGESSSGAGSRLPFAETKVSRHNMGVALANLGPSIDSLRNMGVLSDSNNHHHQHNYHHHHHHQHKDRKTIHSMDPASLNLKLNLNLADEEALSSGVGGDAQELYPSRQQQQSVSRRLSSNGGGGEKRLIMLDVDPCCPRHGISSRHRNSATCMDEACSSKPK